MAIVQKQKPPEDGPNAIGRALRDLAGQPGPLDMLGGAAIDLSQPLPVYRLGLDALKAAGRDSLDAATPIGWRYLLEGSGRAGYADVKETAGRARFTSLSRNRSVDRLMAAAHVAQRVGESLPGDCEARILDVPALFTAAIWLASTQPVFIPYLHPDRLDQSPDSIDVDPAFLDDLVERARNRPDEPPLPRERG